MLEEIYIYLRGLSEGLNLETIRQRVEWKMWEKLVWLQVLCVLGFLEVGDEDGDLREAPRTGKEGSWGWRRGHLQLWALGMHTFCLEAICHAAPARVAWPQSSNSFTLRMIFLRVRQLLLSFNWVRARPGKDCLK